MFFNYILINIRPNILMEGDFDLVLDEVDNNKDFRKPDCEIETYESIEELKYPQENEVGGIIIFDGLNEKEMNDPWVQAMFKRSRHIKLPIFTISQDYYELSKRTIRANCKIYHIFKPNNFGVVLNIYQDNISMDMTLNEFKFLTSICWNEKYQPVTFDMTKDKYTDRYRILLYSILVPDSSPFHFN